jgi:hypothetical protein
MTATQSSERYTVGGDTERERSIERPRAYVLPAAVGLVRVYGHVTLALRLLVRALYLFPIVVLVKILLHVVHPTPEEDYITVAFVVLVVALFGVLALVVFFFALLGPRSSREKQTRLVFRPPTAREADRVGILPQGGAVQVVGRVSAGLDTGATILEDSWGDDAGTIVRSFEGRSFVVAPDDGTPVVVELQGCPVLVGSYGTADTTRLVVPGVGAVMPLGRCTLREGDRVLLIADQGHLGTHPLIHADGASPYREAETGALVVTSEPSRPVVIRLLNL